MQEKAALEEELESERQQHRLTAQRLQQAQEQLLDQQRGTEALTAKLEKLQEQLTAALHTDTAAAQVAASP